MKKILLGVALLALVVAALAAFYLEEIVIAALDPGVPFDASEAPPPPDYADPAAWSALPTREDAADVALPELPAAAPMAIAVDAFYVHPTTYVGSRWNGPVDDAELNAATDELATLIQASAFNACCAIYAPRYRQANGRAFVRPGPDGERALDLAYTDVREAFRFYLLHHNRGRPFLLASHSQGSPLAARLLREEIAGTPLQNRLVVAYLIGGPIAKNPVPGVPVCTAADQIGCVVAWNARGPNHEEGVFDFRMRGERLCVNPLTWRLDEEPAGADLNDGAVFLHAGDGNVLENFANAQCRDGMLIVSEIGAAPRDFMSRILDFVMGPENYHPIEYQMFYVNLRRNAQARAAAYPRARSGSGSG